MVEAQWLDEREQEAWRGFLALRAQLMAHLGRELQRESGLSEADYAVLVELSEAPRQRLRLGVLSTRLSWAKSRLSKQITRMEQRGLVVREDCSTDGRGTFAVLTDAGRAGIDTAAPRHVAQVRRWFVEALTRDQLDALSGISRAVLCRLPSSVPPEWTV